MGWGLDVDKQEEEVRVEGVGGGRRGGLAARQAARARERGRQVLWGEGWIKQINT